MPPSPAPCSLLLCDPDATRLTAHVPGAPASESSQFGGLTLHKLLIQDQLQAEVLLIKVTYLHKAGRWQVTAKTSSCVT